jgi:hypothetical protein
MIRAAGIRAAKGAPVKIDDCRTIDDLLKAQGLTAEEMELHRELIQECRERERKIEECRRMTHDNLSRLSRSLEDFSRTTTALSTALEDLLNQADNLYLRTLPPERFFRE